MKNRMYNDSTTSTLHDISGKNNQEMSLSTQRLLLQVYFTPVLFRAYCYPREPTSTPVLHMPSSSSATFNAIITEPKIFSNLQVTFMVQTLC